MKTQIIATLTDVQPITETANYKSQKITLTVQGFDPNSGEALKPEVFQATIFNKAIAEINASNYLQKKVRATCWLRSLANDKNGSVFYNIVLNCSKIEEV